MAEWTCVRREVDDSRKSERKNMGAIGIREDNLVFDCPICRGDGKNSEREVELSDLFVYEAEDGGLLCRLPECERCGSVSVMVVDDVSDDFVSHVRRVSVARAIDFGSVDDKIDLARSVAIKDRLRSFYAQKGDSDLLDEFLGKKKINKVRDK